MGVAISQRWKENQDEEEAPQTDKQKVPTKEQKAKIHTQGTPWVYKTLIVFMNNKCVHENEMPPQETNPGLHLGRLICYLCTTEAKNVATRVRTGTSCM